MTVRKKMHNQTEVQKPMRMNCTQQVKMCERVKQNQSWFLLGDIQVVKAEGAFFALGKRK